MIVAFWLATIAAPARAQTPGPTPPQKLTSIVQSSSVDPDRASQESDLITPASEVGQLLRDEGVRNEVGITIGRFAIDVYIVESLEADPRAPVVAD